jgi:hypothetical protein
MKVALRVALLLFFCLPLIRRTVLASETRSGFFLPDDVGEVTLKFHSVKNLIVLPVVINDSIKVNLILDTGCRNLVLFGKKFQKLFHMERDKNVQFSGLGVGAPVNGKLSLNNKVSIQAVLGEQIPVVLVPQQNLFSAYSDIHGVIGYDIFIKFEIELNPLRRLITFRPAATSTLSADYQKIPLRVEDSRPIIQSKIFFNETEEQSCDLMLDTGSSLGLLVKTSDLKNFSKTAKKTVLGKGLNGDVVGIETVALKLLLDTFEITSVDAGVTYSWHNYASVGMEIMKDYTIVLNYCKAYAGLKKIA